MEKRIIRKLIDVEIQKGFLSIPSMGIPLMPDEKEKVKVNLVGEGKSRKLSYNPEHRRIFGFTSWYKKKKVKPGDEIEIELVNKKPYSYNIKFLGITEEKSEDKAKKLVDISGLSSVAKGDIVEDRIKELILLHGQGLLNVYKPVADTEGIDLVITRSGTFQPMFLQVKSRFVLTKSGSFLMDIGKKSITPHHSFYVVGAYFDPQKMELYDYILLVPTETLEGNAVVVKPKQGDRFRVTTHLNPKSKSKWAPFIIHKSELANKLLEKFEEMSKYIK
jgi:hypothetical protein